MSEQLIRILYLDDTEEEFMIVRDLLSELPHATIEWVATPAAALQALQSAPFDLCIVDYYLGKSNGVEFVQELHSLGIQKGVILLTGQLDRTILEKAANAGIHQCVDKNKLTIPILAKAIEQAIERG